MNQPSSADGPERKDKVDSQQDTVIGGAADASSLNVTKVGGDDSDDSFSRYDAPQTRSKPLASVRIGEYLVTDTLGRGGMGIVYRARHLTLKREAAIKMMLAGAHATPEQAQRFLIEAQAVAHLQHPNIVQIFDVGKQDEMPYFALELVQGSSLDVQLRDKTLSEREAARLTETLCRAMQFAHEQKILHRDLKPANILMTADGQPKITDFGLARRVEEDSDESARTKVGTIMGTPSYMSPEQARGDVHLLTPATDQYSLGAILYEMLTGRPPFKGARPVDTVMEVIQNEPVSPRQLQPRISVDLETICLKALQKEPAKRYGSCTEMAEDLARFLRGEPILARPVGRVERVWRWCKRNPLVASLSTLAAVALIAVAGISTWSAITLSKKNAELTSRTERLGTFVQRLYSELLDFNVDEAPRVKPARDQLLRSFSETMTEVIQELPREGDAEPTYAAVKMGLADALIDQQRTDEAEKILAEVEEIFRRRIVLKQGSDAARNNLVMLLLKKAGLKRELRRDLKASLDLYEEALQLANEMVDHPKAAADGKGLMPKYLTRSLLADTYADRGVTWYRIGNPTRAIADMERSLELRLKAVDDFTAEPEIAALPPEDIAAEKQFLMDDIDLRRLSTGAAMFRSGRLIDAEPIIRGALELEKAKWQADPHNPMHRNEYVGYAGLLAEFLGFTGRGPEALALLEEAATETDNLLADDPAGVKLRRPASVALYRLSQWREVLNQGDPAAPLSKCLQIREALADAEPENDRRQLDLMLVLARSGQVDDATTIIRKYAAQSNADNEMRLELARALAQCSQRTTDSDAASKYAADAIAQIEKAIAADFADAVLLKGEPDLAPIRSRPEFIALLTKMNPQE